MYIYSYIMSGISKPLMFVISQTVKSGQIEAE